MVGGGHDGGGSLISPDGVAPSQMVGVSAFVILPCTIKSRRFLLALAHLSSSGKRAIKWLCVCADANLFCELCQLVFLVTVKNCINPSNNGFYVDVFACQPLFVRIIQRLRDWFDVAVDKLLR